MGTLIIFNIILILLIACLLVAARKWVRGERARRVLFLVAPLVTILFHYSSFLYHLLFTGAGIEYLGNNPNLILPIYPCNLVMWCALAYGLCRCKGSRLGLLLSDYLFWFGIASTLVGMFANVDFIMNPTLSDYEVTKSIVAHATLLFNVLLIPTFGLLRPEFFRNMRNMILSVVGMYIVGLYCNLIFKALVSPEAAYDVNSMFIIHSPFAGVPFLRYPLIALIGLIIYLMIFTVCDIITIPRGGRWFNCAMDAVRRQYKKIYKGSKAMSDEGGIDTAPACDGEDDGIDDEAAEAIIAEALAGYRSQLEELYENRRRRAIARANMTEEELVASLMGDCEAVLADAEENGVTVITLPDDGAGDDDKK